MHMVGVCGIGMAGLAVLLKKKGFSVSGCDVALNHLAGWLEERGVSVFAGHDSAHVQDRVDWVVRSAAVYDDSPEIKMAFERGLPVFYRGEVLPALLRGHVSVAVSGTHGKTTTSSFIAQVLRVAGWQPSWCIGGEIRDRGDSTMGVSEGGAGAHIIVEADESDGTVAMYRPDIAVVTNVEYDHMEHFANAEAFADCFRGFVSNAGKAVVYCADDNGVVALMSNISFSGVGIKTLSYGFSEGAAVRAVDIQDLGLSQKFKIIQQGICLGEVDLPVPGRHNILNALAVCAVCMELGLSFDDFTIAIKKVGLPGRRFERVVDGADMVVISDYAHHPTEIKVFVDTVRKLYQGRRIIGVFQPHRYTRTLALGADFVNSFEGLHELILCPVYAASERPLKGGTIWDLYSRFREAGVKFVGNPPKVAESLDQAWGYLRRELVAGDVLLVIGAGDIENIAGWAKNEGVRQKHSVPVDIAGIVVRDNEDLGKKTTLHVGGKADILAEVDTVAGLKDLLQWANREGLPFCVLGAGSNVVVNDMGVRGVLARLTGGEFTAISRDLSKPDPAFQPSDPDDGVVVRVGGGISTARMLSWLEEEGLAGLEFLEGVPGRVGGLLRMNAGAAGHEICERVLWISCLKKDGTPCTFGWNEIEWDYRCCRDLQDMIVVEAGLYLDEGDREEIRMLRAKRVERRSWMQGLRSAGSVFKNPGVSDSRTSVVTGTAGALIDRVGMKGVRVGGASVCDSHANFIITEEGATASDVRALMFFVRTEILEKFGIELENEVISLG